MKRIILTAMMVCGSVAFLNAQNNTQWHTVQKGETLFGISKNYQTTVYQIKKDNGNIGKDFKIRVGQKLKVRNDQSLGSNYGKVVGKKQEQNVANNQTPIVHQVSKGETLWSIAKGTYGVEIAQLKSWNNLHGNTIKEGQELVVGYNAIDVNYDSQINNSYNYSQPVSNVSYSFDAPIANNTTTRSNSLSQDQIKDLPVFDPNWASKETQPAVNQRNGNSNGYWNDGKQIAPVKQPDYKITENNQMQNYGHSVKTADPIILKESDEQNAIYTTPVSNMSYASIGDNVAKNLSNTKTKSLLESNELLRPSMASGKAELRTIYNEMRFNNLDKLQIKTDKGPAIGFESTAPNSDMFILHRTLPIGTVVKLTNPVNDYTIYTKVAGKLPDTGENSKALLKMSNKAKSLLNARDAIFMIELEYMASKGGRW